MLTHLFRDSMHKAHVCEIWMVREYTHGWRLPFPRAAMLAIRYPSMNVCGWMFSYWDNRYGSVVPSFILQTAILRNDTYKKQFTVSIDEQIAGEQTMKKTTSHNFISSIFLTLAWPPFVSPHNPSPGRFSDTEPALSFRCQTNGFVTLYKGIVMVELGWRGSGGHRMILVTRYLLASRVENEANNDLKSSLLGCIRNLANYNPRLFGLFCAFQDFLVLLDFSWQDTNKVKHLKRTNMSW